MVLHDKRILVLGAGGFIGSNLCRSLVAAGAIVTAFGRRVQLLGIQGLSIVNGDACDQELVRNLLERHDQVIYLLGASTPASSNADMVRDVTLNLFPAIQIIEAAATASVERFIFISSGGTVYGPDAPLPTTEEAPTNPISSYGIVKLGIEKYLNLFWMMKGLNGISLRVANPYGPFQRSTKQQGVVAALVERAISGEVITIWGDGSVRRDYLFVDDLCDAIISALNYDGQQRVFNVGGGSSRPLTDVIATIRELVPQLQVRYEEARVVDVPVSHLSIEKAKSELGWLPKTAWLDGIRTTYEWFLDDINQPG